MWAVAAAVAQCRQGVLGAEEQAGQVDAAEALPLCKARRLNVLAEK
jgi:hypothetical protein